MGLEIIIPKKVTPSIPEVDKLLRTIAQVILADMKERIHEFGLNAKGTAIGQYSERYLKQRIKAGKLPSKKVILFFSGDMERNFEIIPVKNGYGLGFYNELDTKKSQWMQDRYGPIYKLTPDEIKTMQLIIDDWIKNNY